MASIIKSKNLRVSCYGHQNEKTNFTLYADEGLDFYNIFSISLTAHAYLGVKSTYAAFRMQ